MQKIKTRPLATGSFAKLLYTTFQCINTIICGKNTIDRKVTVAKPQTSILVGDVGSVWNTAMYHQREGHML
jgi:hypothetical protein